MKSPIEIMEEVVSGLSGGGSLAIDCSCGRTHFASHNGTGDWEDGELEDLQRKAKENPDSYIEDPTCDYISWKMLNNRPLIPGCPCGWEKKMADFIVGHRELIVLFLKACNEERKRALPIMDAEIAALENP